MTPNVWVKWHLPRHGRAPWWGASMEWEPGIHGVTISLGRLELRAHVVG